MRSARENFVISNGENPGQIFFISCFAAKPKRRNKFVVPFLSFNRRKTATSTLQNAQYGTDFRTNDSVAVDYASLASAVSDVLAQSGGDTTGSLNAASEQPHAYARLSVIHMPVYFSLDQFGNMGAHSQWNIGNWDEDEQATCRDTRA